MWQLIVTGLALAAPKITLSVLKVLGIGIITYTGLTLFVGQLSGFVSSTYGGLTSDMLAILKMSGITTMFNIIIASYATAASIKATKASFGVLSGT